MFPYPRKETKRSTINSWTVKKGESFDKLAKELSIDSGSGKRGGDLGFFGRGAMVKPFEVASFNLEKDQISEPVKTEFGYHIIKRIT